MPALVIPLRAYSCFSRALTELLEIFPLLILLALLPGSWQTLLLCPTGEGTGHQAGGQACLSPAFYFLKCAHLALGRLSCFVQQGKALGIRQGDRHILHG